MTLTLLGWAIRSVGLLLLTFAAALACGRCSASVRRAVWVLGLLSVVLLPLVWRVTPEISVERDRVPLVGQVMRIPAVARFVDYSEPAEVNCDFGCGSAVAGAGEVWALRVPEVGLGLWGLASFVLLVRLLSGLVSVWLLMRRGSAFSHGEFDELLAEFGIRRRVRLLMSERLATPATAGFFRPVVILPASAADWDAGKMRMVLAHELAHVRQFDWLFSVLAQWVCAMYPFNPFVWIGAHRLRLECEFAADDRVLAAGVLPVEYARGLLEIAHGARRPAAGLVAMARTPMVETRLRAVLDSGRRRGLVRATVWVLSAFALAACCEFAAFRLKSSSAGSAVVAIQSATSHQDVPVAGVAMTADGEPDGWKGPFTVHVVDENGRPCVGAKLCFEMQGSFALLSATTDAGPVTDANGDYEVKPGLLKPTNPLPDGLFRTGTIYAVLASLPGHALSISDYVKKGATKVTVKMGRSLSLRIPVRDGAGHPVAGVAMSVRRLEWGVGSVYVPTPWQKSQYHGVSDADGVVTFLDLPANGRVNYSIDDERYLPAPRDQKNPEVGSHPIYAAVTLVPGATLEGDVRASGRPLAGVHLQANFSEGAQPRVVVSDANGHYRITRVPVGICNVHYTPLGPGDHSIPAGLVARQHNGLSIRSAEWITGLNFDFGVGGTFKGRITNVAGKPVQYEVEAVPVGARRFWRGISGSPADFYALSAPDGSYSLTVPEDRYQLSVGAGSGKVVLETGVRAGETILMDFKKVR